MVLNNSTLCKSFALYYRLMTAAAHPSNLIIKYADDTNDIVLITFQIRVENVVWREKTNCVLNTCEHCHLVCDFMA